MRVGRDVGDRLATRISSGLKLAAGEQIETIVRLHGKRPPADALVLTNARALALNVPAGPRDWVVRQLLADEVETWHLSRKWRSRLDVTTVFGRRLPMGASLSTYDDDVVDDAFTRLVSNAVAADVMPVVRALRADAHWVSQGYGRSVYVLDRTALPGVVGDAVDLDLVERQLAQFELWPSSEVRRHLHVCLPAGGCYVVRQRPGGSAGDVKHEYVTAIADALVVVDVARVKRSPGGEADVIQKLMSIAAHIRTNALWTSSHLDDNGLRIDLTTEVREVAKRCYQVAELRAEIGDQPDGDSVIGDRTAELHDASSTSLDAVVRRLDERVAVLGTYRDKLRSLAREMDALDSASRLDGVADKVAQLAASTVGDDEAVERLVGLVPKARESSDAVPLAMESLRGEIEQLRQPLLSAV